MPIRRDNAARPADNRLTVFLGMVASQIAATFFVRSANLDLLREMTAIIDAGYHGVPSAQVAKGLSWWFNAFMGGIFFTVTTGVLTIFVTLGLIRLMQQTRLGFPRQAAVVGALWLALIIFINLSGLNNGATLYISAIMATVAVSGFVSGKKRPQTGKPLRRFAIVFTPLVLLTGLYLTRLDADIFVEIRDRVLFSNPVGVKVVEFYYDYTLYGAQAMAPLTQHTMVGVDMSDVQRDNDYPELSLALRRVDVLDVDDARGAAVTLIPSGEGIRWQDATGRATEADRKNILQDPRTVLERFSGTADRNKTFRLLTLAGIFVGFPVMLYLAVFTVIEGLMAYVAGRHAGWITAVLCLVIGAGLFYPLAAGAGFDGEGRSLDAMWKQGTTPARISVLKAAAKAGVSPLKYPNADALTHSVKVSERYWFARALAGDQSERGFELLQRMMLDRSPLVLCQVCYAFGEMQNRQAIPILLRYIKNGSCWYTQRYAYIALKKLGWIQPPGKIRS